MKMLPLAPLRPSNRRCRRVFLTLEENQAPFIEGVFSYGEKAGWLIDTVSSRNHLPPYWRGDGIVTQFSFCAAADRPLRAFLRSLSLPCVSVGTVPGDVDAAVVMVDHRAIAEMAANYLADHRHRHFLCVHGPGSDWVHRVRRAGFCEAIAARGGTNFTFEWDEHSADSLALIEKLAVLLREIPQPLGVWATSDRLAMQVLTAGEFAGLSVPEDVAVLGGDKNPLAERHSPVPLSTIDNGYEIVGYRAAALLDRMMDGAPAPSQSTYVKPKGVICRRSTDSIVARSPSVAAAIHFMKEHFQGEVRMDALSKSLGFSPPTLFAAFRKDLQRTPMEILLELRLREAERLLFESDDKIEFIAHTCGFGSKTNFCRVFKKARGISPGAWRLRKQDKTGASVEDAPCFAEPAVL